MTGDDVPVGGPSTRVVEPVDESCISLLYFLRRAAIEPAQQRLLMADYAARRTSLPSGLRSAMDDEFFQTHLPSPGGLPGLDGLITAAQDDGAGDRRFAPEDIGAAGVPDPADTEPGNAVPPAGADAASGEGVPVPPKLDRIVTMTPRSPVDIAVVVAAGADLQAVRDVFRPSTGGPVDGGQRMYWAQVVCDNSAEKLRIAILPRAGSSPFDVFQFCDPGALFLVGSATVDHRKVRRGDVVIPRRVRRDAGPEQLLLPQGLSYSLDCYDPASAGFHREFKSLLRRMGDQKPRIPPRFEPRVRLDADALTSAVPLRAASGHAQLADPGDNDFPVLVTDEDSWDFGSASNGRWWAVVKGISEIGGAQQKTSDSRDKWRYVAVSTAALCLKNFLQKEYLPPQNLVF